MTTRERAGAAIQIPKLPRNPMFPLQRRDYPTPLQERESTRLRTEAAPTQRHEDSPSLSPPPLASLVPSGTIPTVSPSLPHREDAAALRIPHPSVLKGGLASQTKTERDPFTAFHLAYGTEKLTMLAPGEPRLGDHSIIWGPPLKRPSPLLPPSELPSE